MASTRLAKLVEFEFNAAREQDPEKILVYVKDNVEREPALQEFVDRLENFKTGYFRALFTTPEELHDRIQQDIGRWLAARAIQSGPI